MPFPFRADHIGSLIRPGYLLEAQNAVSPGLRMHNADYNSADAMLVQTLRESEKKAIAEVVDEQVRRGITPITSGEFERASFVDGFFELLDGMKIQFKSISSFLTNHPILKLYQRLKLPGRDQPVATGKVKWKRSAYLHEFEYVKSLLPEERWKDIKITVPSPSWSYTQLKDGESYTEAAYADPIEYLKDLGEVVRREILALYDAGVLSTGFP